MLCAQPSITGMKSSRTVTKHKYCPWLGDEGKLDTTEVTLGVPVHVCLLWMSGAHVAHPSKSTYR